MGLRQGLKLFIWHGPQPVGPPDFSRKDLLQRSSGFAVRVQSLARCASKRFVNLGIPRPPLVGFRKIDRELMFMSPRINPAILDSSSSIFPAVSVANKP